MSEPIPSAIARGPQAETPGAIRPARAGIVAGLLAAVFALTAFVVAPVPDRALSLVGGDATQLGRAGGMRIVWAPPAGADLAKVEDVFAARHRGGRVSRDGDALVIEVGGVGPDEVARAAKLLTSGGLAFHRSVIAPEMPELANTYGFEIGEDATAAVRLEIDQWQPEDGGARRTDYFVLGPTREAIEAALDGARAKGWRLPDGTRIAYEHVDRWGGQPAFWRTYVIETQAALGGEHVADAMASYDPNTNRPIVLLDFTREGTRIFGDVTSSMVGGKLATLLGGDVMSAPIINGPILGGRASIAMGGTEVRKQEKERDALIGVLRAGELPAGGALREATYIEPSVTATQEWLARVVLALGAGLLVGLIAWVLVRTTHPVWRTPEVRLPGSVPWVRLGALLLAPLVVIGASAITAPGVDEEQLANTIGDASQFSLGMLGLTPLLTSFLLVELIATLVPSWRLRRHAGPSARLPFDLATLALAIALSVVQSWHVAVYLERLDAAPIGGARLLFLASMAGVTMLFAFVAWVIRVYGAGNGYAALLVTGFVWAIYGAMVRETTPSISAASLVVAVALIVVPAIAMGGVLRMRIARAGQAPLRVPTSGVAPIFEVSGVLSLIVAMVGMIDIGALAEKLFVARMWLHDAGRVVALVLGVAFALLWSWMFSRPSAVRPFAERASLAAPSVESWRSATILTVGTLVVMAAGYVAVGEAANIGIMGVMISAIVAAFVLDVYDDLRGRRGRLAYVWSLQSAQHADIAAHALGAETIAFHMSGANLRTLFAWFGPFAPIDVWVRREDVGRARDALAKVFAAIDRSTPIGSPARSTSVALAK
ncbi:MAG: hypothetical protein AB7T06_21235 [Kofleriaceae bacterium]